MQKIVITNFGPVKQAEIEIKDILVLIGQQASGKSTIAKLIYFFKSLGDVFFDRLYKAERPVYEVMDDIKLPIRSKFYEFFGSTMHLPYFEITYYYEHNRHLTLKLGTDRKLLADFSRNFFGPIFQREINNAKRLTIEIEAKITGNNDVREKIALEQDKLKAIQTISKLIDDLFGNHHTSSLYAIAGRETTVSYEATFEGYLEISLNNLLDENRKKTEDAKRQTIDEALMIGFLKEVRRVKEIFKKYGGSFSELISNIGENSDIPIVFLNNISLILKGEYRFDTWGEKIVFENGQYVYLKDGSSGQKEVIRILQDMVLSILEKQNALRVIEEPEAHLFPVAQKQLMEVLVSMLNINPKNQLIITTHSPYILTVLNNLLFATRVIAKNKAHKEAIEAHIPSIFHINPANFAVYSLGNSLMEGNEYCENIFNEKTGTIKQNYLDTVSDILGSDFQFLYNLHANTLRR